MGLAAGAAAWRAAGRRDDDGKPRCAHNGINGVISTITVRVIVGQLCFWGIFNPDNAFSTMRCSHNRLDITISTITGRVIVGYLCSWRFCGPDITFPTINVRVIVRVIACI